MSLGDLGWQLSSHEAPVRPPLLCASLPDRVEKRLVSECFELLAALASRLGVTELTTVECPRDGRFGLFHQAQMERGARITTTHMLAVDLGLDLESIRGNFRKSFRPLVTKGLATWSSDVVGGTRTPVWEEFQTLHREVAGRITRGIETWDLQHEALARGEAFLVSLRDKSTRRLVGAGYFNVSRTDGLYSVAAYDRSLFQLPLGHVVQYRAIEHMKSLGLGWYWLGARPFPGDEPVPSEKESQIAAFKQGFATHVLPVFTLRGPAASSAPAVPDAGG
jgi:FemAB family protein